jgi:hypothetical protein
MLSKENVAGACRFLAHWLITESIDVPVRLRYFVWRMDLIHE